MGRNDLVADGKEALGEPAGGKVAVLRSEGGVAADIGK
jgi:hypothetical protein